MFVVELVSREEAKRGLELVLRLESLNGHPALRMSSVEQRLARLENHISQQSKKIDEQASLILKLSTENERQALALARLEREERASTRSIQHISEFVFTSGEWAEEGTKLRRWKAAQSWKQGDEGPQKWEWLVRVDLDSSFLPPSPRPPPLPV